MADCLISAGTVFEDFDTASEWTVDSAEAYTPLDEFITLSGVGSVRLASKPNVTAARMTKTISANLSALASSCAKLDVHLRHSWPTNSSSAGLVNVTVEFSSTTDFSKKFMWTSPGAHGGWNRYSIAPGAWVNTGSESWSNTMVRMRVGITCNSANSLVTAHFDSFHVGWQTTPAVVLVFGGCYIGQYTNAVPIMDNYGVKATVVPSIMKLGTTGGTPTQTRGDVSGWTTDHMSVAQLKQMYDAGHEVTLAPKARYNNDHYSWHNRSESDAIKDIEDALTDLQSWGIMPSTFLSWGANTDARLLDLQDRFGITASFDYHATMYESPPVADSRQLWACDGFAEPTTLNQAKAYIDTIAANGGTYLLGFTDIDDSGLNAPYYWQATKFDGLLDYIVNTKGISVMTLSDWYQFASDSRYKALPGHVGSIVLGSIDLNNGINMFVDDEGFDTGQRRTTWEEVPNYSGAANAQVNVSRGGLVPVTIPMRVHGSSQADLHAKLNALWSEVDKMSNKLVVGDETFEIVASSRPENIERDSMYALGNVARFTLVLTRKP